MNEELKEAHEQATQEPTKEENAHGLDLSLSSKRLAEDNTREIILTALELNDINHDTLNMSKSKFNKLNKEKLIEALKGKINEPTKEEKTSDKAKDDFDYIGAILSLKSTFEKSRKSNDYTALDGEIATTVLSAMNSDENIQQIDIQSGNITKIIIGLGGLYFVSRLIGFETISNKLNEIKNKVLNRKEEVKKDEK